MSHVITPCETKIHHKLIIAGYGGQGVLKLGLTLAEAAMHEGREVIWTPAYGPEMRGGPSFCTVIISSDPIGAPVVDQADAAIIMDRPSLPKYQYRVKESGLIIINSSLVDPSELRNDIPCYAIPANQLAEEIGEPKTANMVVLGALLHLTKLAKPETVIAALSEALPEKHKKLIPVNEKALLLGAERVEKLS